jgi:NAD(P)-dependent dehydrogenase (short-subunit alcohol dehydrogenase family)
MAGRVSYDFGGAVVMVTGGARGQGLSHALAFARSGATVVVLDLGRAAIDGVPYGLSGPEDLGCAQQQLAAVSPEHRVLAVDVTDEAQVADAFARVRCDFGRVDVLINNAGVNGVASIEGTTSALLGAVTRVNLVGTFLCCKHAMAPMRSAGGGRIVNVASMAAFVGGVNQVAYAATKAGVVGLTRALAVEAGPHNIRVNAVCPSLVMSPQSVGLTKSAAASGARPSFGPVMPYVLPGLTALDAQDVTGVVLWLSSEAARWVTGTVLTLDGGRSIK